MKEFILLITMIFFHIIDDFKFQGILCNLKQKSWWEKQDSYNNKYKNDWLVALIAHSFSWAVMAYIPVCVYIYLYGIAQSALIWLIINFFIHIILHAYVDNEKCNKLKINLIQDQICHLIQIMTIWALVIS